MSHVIGIDIGTSGIKVGAMSKEGVMGYLEYQPYSLLYPCKGWVEIDLEDIWTKVKSLLINVRRQIDQEGTVDAIALSTFCNSSVFMNEQGEALYPGIMYLDQRSKEEAEWIKRTVGETRLTEITRNRLEPGMYTATSHLWFKNNHPDLYEQTYKWGNLSTFILNKLTGNFVMDWTHASFSGMYDVENYEWSHEICMRIGIDGVRLPEVVDPSSIIGYLKLPELAEKGIPVIAGAADTACSTVALGIEPGQLFESVGTSNVLTVCTDDPSALDQRFLNRCHVVKGRWLSHGAMSFPGASIQWFYEQFLKTEGYCKEVLNDLFKQSTVGANGIFFLPYMKGERSPIWDPNATGVFTGIGLNSSKADMYRAILEGCSFGLKQIMEIIDSKYNLQVESIPSIGGGSKNEGWAQIKSTLLNKNIEIKAISETGVLGACLIAGCSVGYFSSLEQASEEIKNETIRVVEPEPEKKESYQALYEVFLELYPSLKAFFGLHAKVELKGGNET
jgi:xylulokinase